MQRRCVRDGDLADIIISSDGHCECLTKVRGECGQATKSKVPADNICIDIMWKDLKGVGIGCGDFANSTSGES
jgi:hypothetical protein